MGQSIISAGLIIIVTIAVINANRLVINAEVTKMEAMARLQGADIAMELITEARMKKFDENAITAEYQAASEFKAPWELRRDGGSEDDFSLPESYPYSSTKEFDDFDDYNLYSRNVDTPSLSGYVVACKVYYATQDVPDVAVNYRTYVKTLEVYVSHPLYLTTPIRISFTNTY